MRSAALLVGAALALAACGSSGGDDPGPTSTKLVPTSYAGIEGT